jgi:hypothetical protein
LPSFSFGLNCYLYAPKDDHKHRALWRDPYTGAEREELKELMDACRENNVEFFYGISPGLDMRYSSQQDVQARPIWIMMKNLVILFSFIVSQSMSVFYENHYKTDMAYPS